MCYFINDNAKLLTNNNDMTIYYGEITIKNNSRKKSIVDIGKSSKLKSNFWSI